jgi:hypothetical protein
MFLLDLSQIVNTGSKMSLTKIYIPSHCIQAPQLEGEATEETAERGGIGGPVSKVL